MLYKPDEFLKVGSMGSDSHHDSRVPFELPQIVPLNAQVGAWNPALTSLNAKMQS